MKRSVTVKRKTAETDVTIMLNLDGKGDSEVKTGIGFLDHMLALMAKHGLFDLKVRAKGDLEVDIHHTNEDVGICLGESFKKALKEKRGIKRFGFACVPMDEALVRIALDISGRPHLPTIHTPPGYSSESEKKEKKYSLDYARQFLKAFVTHSRITMNISILSGTDMHHTLEALFKTLGRALDQATQIDPRIKGIPSTKGRL